MGENKNILITGGTRGIGLQIVKKFISKKWSVFVISRECNFDCELSTNDLKLVKCFNCDLTDKNYIKKVLSHLKSIKFDCVVANVGSGFGTRETFPSEEEWNSLWDLNFKSAQYTAQYFTPKIKQKIGNLIFISSIAGAEFLDAPVAYSVSKSALITYSKILSKKLAPKIKVNTIVPGNILTDSGVWDQKLKKNYNETMDYINNNVPTNNFGNPDEIAGIIYLIAKNKVSFLNGSSIVIDGGQTNNF